jgi:hypothetical protein
MGWIPKAIALAILLPIALGLAWLGVNLINKSRAALRDSPRAIGTVTEVTGLRRYKIEVALDGMQFTLDHDTHSDLVQYQAGEQVEVLFNRDKPEESIVKSFVTLWASACVTFFFAAVMGAVCIFVWRIDASPKTPEQMIAEMRSGTDPWPAAESPAAEDRAYEAPPGDGADIVLHGPREWWMANLFWSTLGLGLLAMAVFSDGSRLERFAMGTAGALWFCGLVAWSVHNRSLEFRSDHQGISLKSRLMSKRVDWGQIASIKRITHGRKAQERYDRDWRRRRGNTTRPRVWHTVTLFDQAGGKLLDLSEELQPGPALLRLISRVEKRTGKTMTRDER